MDAAQTLREILERELKKLSEASAMPHCLSADQVEALERLSRILKQAPEPAPKDEASSAADLSSLFER